MKLHKITVLTIVLETVQLGTVIFQYLSDCLFK